MKTLHSLFALCAIVPLSSGCPASDPGQAEGSTGVMGPTESGTLPSTTVPTPAVDSSSGPSPSTGSTGSSSDGPAECVADEECDNGVFCDGLEGCVDGQCVQGPPLDCDDGVDCTVDSCDDTRGMCLHEPDNSVCGCAQTCDVRLGCGDHCVPAVCQGQIYDCGDCIDNDADCGVDNYDTDCWGPCDNNESGWAGEVPGQQNQSECNTMDCYFDQNSGSGNDECYWSHSCDPLEPTGCVYNPMHNLPGTPLGCDELQMMQSMECLAYCSPLVPNGCDCFGCCDVTLDDGTEVTVYLGTRDPETDLGTCNLDNAADPALCHPCTQVDSCLNTCEMCELCLGQQELPPECEEQECPEPLLPCGQPGQDPCPMGQACVTGCCVPEPQ